MDGWITCNLTSFWTVFQSYQVDEKLIIKGCVQWNSVYCWEDFASSGDRTRFARIREKRQNRISKKKTRMDFTRMKKQNASYRAQSKEYEITRSMKLYKYPTHYAYLFHRARDIRQLTWPCNIGQGKMWVRHWDDMIYMEVYANYYALCPYCYWVMDLKTQPKFTEPLQVCRCQKWVIVFRRSPLGVTVDQVSSA